MLQLQNCQKRNVSWTPFVQANHCRKERKPRSPEPFTEVPRKAYHFSSAEESRRFHRVTNNRERCKGGGRPEKVDRNTKSEIDANKLRQCVKSIEKRTGKSIKTWSLKNEWKILCLEYHNFKGKVSDRRTKQLYNHYMRKMKSEKIPCAKTERKSEHKTSRYATLSKERVSDLKQETENDSETSSSYLEHDKMKQYAHEVINQAEIEFSSSPAPSVVRKGSLRTQQDIIGDYVAKICAKVASHYSKLLPVLSDNSRDQTTTAELVGNDIHNSCVDSNSSELRSFIKEKYMKDKKTKGSGKKKCVTKFADPFSDLADDNNKSDYSSIKSATDSVQVAI